MTVHTLIEYAKTMPDDRAGQKARAVIEMFAAEADFYGVMPFKPAPGGVYRYQREGELPSNMGFRAINELPAAGHGVINDYVEQCFPIAGNIDVDRVLLSRFGMSRRATEERMSIKRKAKILADTFIDGDNHSQPREYTGLKARLKAVNGSIDGSNAESRVMTNDASSGGGPLSLSKLDIAIANVENPTHIIMPKIIRDRFSAATRDTGVSGFYTQDKDSLGRPVHRYNGLPMLIGYGISPFGNFLPFNEVGSGGGSAVTASIYVVSFSEYGVAGLETKPMEVRDMGLLENGVHYRTNIEHDTGLCVEGAYSALRLTSITNAAIVK